MKKFLKRLKLIDYLTTELKISKARFVAKLTSVTDEGNTGEFSNPFEAFSSGNNEFKGHITYDGFKIKRRRKFFDTNINIAVATGSFSEENENLKIETEINGFNRFFIPFYIILIIFYSIFFLGLSKSNTNSVFFVFPFLILHASIMFGIPYLMMRRSVKRLKYELEREFYYLTKE